MPLGSFEPAIEMNAIHALRRIFQQRIESPQLAELLVIAVALVTTLVLCLIVNFIFRRVVQPWIERLIRRSAVKWDDVFLKWHVFDRLAPLVPALVFYALVPVVLDDYPRLASWFSRLTVVYMIVWGVMVAEAFLNALFDVYQSFAFSKPFPIKSAIQVVKIAAYSVGTILIVAVVANKTPVYLLSGMGALTAVLMLIFKDSILGFVAGIQLSSNQMVALGDWIEMPKYGADGTVIDLALTTVKVQNWDNTVTMIPSYALISDSFKNWRYMSESGGRQIKRAVNIDLQSVHFCTEEMLRRFEKIQYISDYLIAKQREIEAYNRTNGIDLASLANGRRLTNIGVFRAYLLAYLRHHPMINQEMTVMVRQLDPTETGLPIEIYAFCKDKEWVNYESIQSDIFDHTFAVIPEFDLRVFQNPAGADFKALGGAERQ